MATEDFNVKLLGKIPFEKEIGQQGDKGIPFIIKYPDSESSKAFKSIIKNIEQILEKGNGKNKEEWI